MCRKTPALLIKGLETQWGGLQIKSNLKTISVTESLFLCPLPGSFLSLSLSLSFTLSLTLSLALTFFYFPNKMTCVVSHVRYCKILGISNKDHVTNEEVRAKIQQAHGPHEDLLTIVKRCKANCSGMGMSPIHQV